MPRDGTATRNRIMDVAQAMVLNVGLAGTSVEKVIEGASVTKGTFFYHFKTKHDLAASLIERYADQDERHFADAMLKAEQLARDPLQQLLIFVGLFIEMTEQLEEPFILSKVMQEPKLASEQLVQCRNYLELLFTS